MKFHTFNSVKKIVESNTSKSWNNFETFTSILEMQKNFNNCISLISLKIGS